MRLGLLNAAVKSALAGNLDAEDLRDQLRTDELREYWTTLAVYRAGEDGGSRVIFEVYRSGAWSTVTSSTLFERVGASS